MLKSYIKKIVKTELAKQKLNGDKKVLKDVLEESNNYVIFLAQEYEKLEQENEKLKNSLKGSKNKILELKELYSTEKLEKNKLLFNGYGEKYEIDSLKKELRDSKNGLNGANHVIKNNKEWINSQDKKIKELEGKIRCLKSDKEDLQYNVRRKSTQKIQLETKNKFLEEKLTKISSAINPVRNTSQYGLMCTIDTIRNILKES